MGNKFVKASAIVQSTESIQRAEFRDQVQLSFSHQIVLSRDYTTACRIAINGVEAFQDTHETPDIIGGLPMNDIEIDRACRRAVNDGGSSADNDKFHSRRCQAFYQCT